MENNSLSFDSRSLKKYFSKEKFLSDTVLQIQKDLETDIDVNIHSEFIYEELIEKIRKYLSENLNKIDQIIYRVDLNESDYKSALQADPQLSDLARLVLIREAQKIYIRMHI